jgi:hypothetical protein
MTTGGTLIENRGAEETPLAPEFREQYARARDMRNKMRSQLHTGWSFDKISNEIKARPIGGRHGPRNTA